MQKNGKVEKRTRTKQRERIAGFAGYGRLAAAWDSLWPPLQNWTLYWFWISVAIIRYFREQA